jgi:hypothetical protein
MTDSDDTEQLPSAGAAKVGDAIDEELLSDETDLWPKRTARSGLRLRVPTAILLALLIAAGAFWGGAAVQQSQGSPTSASAFASRFRSAASSLFSSSRARSFFGGAGAPAASGTVTEVKGNTVYVTESSGSLVTVKVGTSTAITRDAAASTSALKLGDTVIVEGSTAKNGTVTATSISASAAGLTSGSGLSSAG